MSSTFDKLTQEKLNNAVAEVLNPLIEALLTERGPGHCMRVTDLDEQIMEVVCKTVRHLKPKCNVYILGNQMAIGNPYWITSTKLVELRNPDELGQLRPPLIVFIPNSIRTSAEDSFGVATFEEISFTFIYDELLVSLLERLPSSLVNPVKNIFEIMNEQKWIYSDCVSQVRFLMTALDNGVDGESLGAGLYELSLIPDFKLFEDISLLNVKIRQNINCVRSLVNSYKSVRGRIINLGLTDKLLEKKILAFFEKQEIQEPESWTPYIALDKAWWNISFDKWKFKEGLFLDKIRINVIETDLPIILEDESDDQFTGLIGQQVLVPKDRKRMNMIFEVNPHPSIINGLDHFTIQVISQDNGPVGKSQKVKVWNTSRLQCTVGITKLNKIEFEEGWHFLRVLPWTVDGDPIPLNSEIDTKKELNESEMFYVLPTGKLEEDPPQRTTPIEHSVEHARLRLKFAALYENRDLDEVVVTDVLWEGKDQSKKNTKLENLIVKFGREGIYQIPISRILKSIESRILSYPKHPSGWRMQINMMNAENPSEVRMELPSTVFVKSFLSAREDLFLKIQEGDLDLVTQGFSFEKHSETCVAYTESYLNLVRNMLNLIETTSGTEQQQNLKALRNVLTVDSIHVIIKDFQGHHREAVLIAPTHPLKIQWYLDWTDLSQKWILGIEKGTKEHIATIRSSLLDGLSPLAFPVGIPVDDGRVFVPVENINPFWGLYAPTTEENISGLMTDICGALGIKETNEVFDFSGNVIADKIERYLSQHPYIRELSINIFNPGSGRILAEALLALQQNSEYADLRYDIRMFGNFPEATSFGEIIENLIRPDSTINEAADAFVTSTGSHIFSKLNIARYSLIEFDNNAERFSAHISILMDLFPTEALSVAEKSTGGLSLNGLIQDFESEFTDDETGTYWSKFPIVGNTSLLEVNDESYNLLASLSRSITFGTAAVATSGCGYNSVPVVTLGLNSKQRELIYEVHKTSDWVFTIDRNMGIEFYDHGGQIDRPDYLIDYVPNTNPQGTRGLIISSRSNDEIVALLKPILLEKGLSATTDQSVQLLSYLRSLSGQLALKLISASTQQLEALGLALARLYLEYQGALSNQIIVPLDAHTNLYRSSGDKEIDDEISLQRTDLALFDLDLAGKLVICNLIEVKCYSQVGDFSAYNQLKERISAQINQSERILQRHFDPALKKPDRPDRQLKSREFAKILRFYLERSIRYGIFEPDATEEAIDFIKLIEQGYSLQFRRSALIFDLEKNGTEPPETEVGIEYHRIGKDLINTLLENCGTHYITEEPVGKSLSELFIQNVPKLSTAAFIAPRRTRTTHETIKKTQGDKWRESSGKYEKVTKDQSTQTVTPSIEDVENKSKQNNGDDSSLKDEKRIDTTETNNKVMLGNEFDTEPSENFQKNTSIEYDVMLGINGDSPQYGLLGEVVGRKIALDLNHTHTISLFGVQGGGKSYTLGTVIEMATIQIEKINVLPSPLATVIFHYSPTQDYAPEFTSMIQANSIDDEVQILRERYHANPERMKDVLILTPRNKVEDRQVEYPDIEVRPISFSASELKASHWKFLMGAIGSQSMYLRQINLIMRTLRNNLTLMGIQNGIENSSLSDHLKELALTRLSFASEYIDDNQRLQDLIHPGRLIIVDLRDEYIEKDEALGLFVVMLQIFSEATYKGTTFNKLVVFDEAHKYIENDDLISGLVEVVREMRHKGTSIMVASQDPPSVPISLIELSTQIIMHKFNSPAWLKHIQKANAALGELTSEKMSHLGTGEAYIWSSKASDSSFSRGAVKIKCRPRVTQHGGSTKTAVENQ